MIPEKFGYVLRYGVLDSAKIFNECGPYSGGPAGWDEESIAARQRKGDLYIAHRNSIDNFFNRIEESILKDGFRNPILVDAGMCAHIMDRGKHPRLPIPMQDNHELILTCNTNGGSRLWVAQNHNLKIPCIISDFTTTGKYDHFPEIETREELLSYYTDLPIKMRAREYGFRLNLGHHQPHMDD